MSTFKKSFIAGIMMFAAIAMVIPVATNAEMIREKPKVTDEDVTLTVRVHPGYRYRSGYHYGPYRYHYYAPHPRYHYSQPYYRGYYHYPNSGVRFRAGWGGRW